MISSGRRVRKRILEECNGNTSGNNRIKKSKGSSKSRKRKSSKAKTSRPQRTAAHNARNMFVQIGETSTDGEDDDSDDESSDSFQDSENFSEPERKIHNKREELKKPLLEESADASKPPLYSEYQANLESRPRLVLKLSLRDSKKNVPLEDRRFACENQADVVCQSSIPQPLECVKKTSPEKSFMCPDTNGMSDDTNTNLLECHNRNENAISYLDTSVCHEGRTDQRRHTYELSRSGDALLPDTEVNGHPEFNAIGYAKPDKSVKNIFMTLRHFSYLVTSSNSKSNVFSTMFCRKSEHMTNKLEADSSMVNIELSDFDNTAIFSSLESWGMDNHQQIADGPIASGYDRLNVGDKGRSRSDKCTEGSLENNEVVHSSHTQDHKMKAPFKPTKIIIKKKQPPEDIANPSKLKVGIPKADSIGARSDVISGNPGFTWPDRLTQALEGGDGTSTSSPQLLNSYFDQRSYNHVNERNKSHKREPNQRDSGVDLSNVVSDPIRRPRSIRMKTTSEEPNALNTRIIIRGGQSSRGTSSWEDSSIKVSDELHQSTRSARNRSDEYIASDPGTLTRSMPNHHAKKLSWLMLSEEHEEGYRYIPQLGDKVVYLRQVVYVMIFFPYKSYYLLCFGMQVSAICFLVYIL